MTVRPLPEKLDRPPSSVVNLKEEGTMTIHVEFPEPLAAQVTDAARSRATSPERYVLDALSKTVAADSQSPPPQLNGTDKDPVLGVLADDADLLDAIVAEAMLRRRTAPLRTPRE